MGMDEQVFDDTWRTLVTWPFRGSQPIRYSMMKPNRCATIRHLQANEARLCRDLEARLGEAADQG